ncbi:hypothetical protein [Bifidobacterium eulemuris]|uniref:Uncharacterized protein n=1 Tax=Bifidobacterium eulemuris TaxID=1765219 RepID=A0A261GA50_9BIFI|nr:hypothetical protein [Bifidobacterium eulemuris]OZG68288.1 hypothetical protein BEUL_1301 [Bifidobacterium eulemuris]QOL31658.1 hypothetical protein BE0216_03670 [Bifidobacterium eulemuris]
MPAYLNGKLIESPPLMNGVQVNALYNGLMVWPYRFPALFIRVMARVDGQSLMVEQSVMAKCHRRYLITDAGSEPIVEYDTVCRKADGWTDWPESGEVSGAEGQIVSVVDCTTAGAKARAYGTAVLPKPLSRNLLQYGPVAETDGVTVGVDGEGAVTLTGTTTKTWQTVKWDLDKSKFVPGGTYTLSQNPKVDGYRNIQTWIYVDGVTVGRTDLLSGEEAKERDTFTLPDVIGTISLNLRMINNNTDQGGVAYKLQLEAGDVATAWQRPDVTDLDQGVIAAVNLLSVGPVADGDKSVAVAADGLTATGLAAGDKAVWSNQVSLPAGTYTMGNLAPSGTVVLSGTGMGTEIVNGGASRTITIAEDVADATAEVQFWNFGQPVKPYLVSGDTAPAEYIRPISETNGGGAIDLRTNLLRYGDATENGLTCTVLDDGGVHITGTAVGSWGGVRWFLDNALFQPGATYTLSGGVYDAPAGALLGSIVVKTTSGAAAVDTSFSYESRSTRFTMPDDFSSIEFRIRSGSAPASVDVVLHPQLEIGTVVTTWEPGEVVAGGGAGG